MKTLGNLLNALFTVTGFIYALGSLALLVARLLPPPLGTFDGVALYNSLLPAMLFPALVYFLVALIFRRWLLTGLNLLLLAVFAFWYAPFFVPTGGNAPRDDERELSVLTYNTLMEYHDFETFVQTVRFVDADIVALQELHPDYAPGVVGALVPTYPYHITISDQGLFSKFPLDDSQTTEIWQNSRFADALRAVADVDGVPVTVVVFHPPPPRVWNLMSLGFQDDIRQVAYDQLLALLEDEDGRVIVAGDFNATDRSAPYWSLRDAGYRDVYRETSFGLGLTFPHGEAIDPRLNTLWWLLRSSPPLVRIDYVMHNGVGLRSLDGAVLYTGDSDHYPLVARLGLAEPNVRTAPGGS